MDERQGALFEETEGGLTEDKLDLLKSLCDEQKTLEREIEEQDDVVKSLKAELEEVSRVKIPNLLNEVGLSELKLRSGEKVVIQDKIKASIANKNYLLAYRNMLNSEGGDEIAQTKIDSLFKSNVVIEGEELDDSILDMLLDKDIPYEMKKTIHAQTLAKYCREKLEKGEVIPEGISVFQYQETKIK